MIDEAPMGAAEDNAVGRLLDTYFQALGRLPCTDQFIESVRHAIDAAWAESFDPDLDGLPLLLVWANEPEEAHQDVLPYYDSDASPATHVAEPTTNDLLDGRAKRYRLLDRIGDGERVLTFRAAPVPSEHSDERAVIKIPLVSGAGLLIRRLLSRLDESFARELRTSLRLDGSSHAARIIDRGKWSMRLGRTSVDVPFVVYEHVTGLQLDRYVRQRHALDGDFRGVPTGQLFFAYARDLVAAVRDVHERLVIHGDINPSNILFSHDRMVLVDFGQAHMRDLMPASGGTKPRWHPYQAPERGFSVQADVYSLGGVLYFLATGEHPPRPAKDLNLHARVVSRMKSLNPRLYEDNFGIAEIITHCLCYSPYERARTASAALRDLDLFDVPRPDMIPSLSSGLTPPIENPHYRLMALQQYRKFAGTLSDMSRGVYEVTGDHDELVASLTEFLAGARATRGSRYCTFTVPSFWSEQNAELSGRFLAMNKELAKHSAVRRLFLLLESERDTSGTRAVLRAHLNAMLEVPAPVTWHAGETVDVESRGYWAGCVFFSDRLERDKARSDLHAGVMFNDGHWTSFIPMYHEAGGHEPRLFGLRFRAGVNHARPLMESFLALSRRAIDLRELLI